jgi:HEAT repeat protein
MMLRLKTAALLIPALFLAPEIASASAAQRADEGPRSTPAAESSESAEALAVERRRILHLSSGTVFRGKSRLADGQWQIRVRGNWQSMPAEVVTRARDERDVLRECKRLTKANGRQPTAEQRVRLADWMVEQGLYSEAFGELDRVLDADPDHARALAALPDGLMPVPNVDVDPEAAEEARAKLYTFGAGATPCGREYAIRELRAHADAELVQAELSVELRSQSLRRRSFAAFALGRLQPGAELKNLLMHAILDPSEDARRASAQAVAATHDPAVLVPMIRALSSNSSRVRTQAAEALGNAKMEHAVEPLMIHLAGLNAAQAENAKRRVPHGNIFVGKQYAYVQDFDVEVAQFQAVADPQVNVLIEGDVLDAGVHSIGEYAFTYESRVVRGSLAQLTGQVPGHTNRAWLSWWQDNQGDWKAASAAAAAPETPGR